MQREVFKSRPIRGLPNGLISGFMYGCVILLIGLAMGVDEDMFIPLLIAAVVLGGIVGIISCIGKKVEADENGIYVKNKEYLFAENDMYMNVHTHYYGAVPVTERWINISGRDGKHELKCSFLDRQDAGRLAKIVEDGMRKKFRALYDGLAMENDGAQDITVPAVQTFAIPAAELAETIDKRCRLLVRIMFWFLTIVFSWILISMIIQDQLEDYGLGLLGYMALNLLILGGVNFSMIKRFKAAAQKIPCEIMFSSGTMYIDGKAFGGTDIKRVIMTPMKGSGTGDFRKLVFYVNDMTNCEYSFGFRADRKGFPEYVQLAEAVKNNFGDKFAYDMN